MPEPSRPHQVRLRIPVADLAELTARYGAELQLRSLYLRHDRPPAVGTRVLVEFGDAAPGVAPLATLTGLVAHARIAATPGEATAGLQLQILDLDAAALAAATAGATPQVQLTESAPAQGLHLATDNSGTGGAILGIDLGTVNTCVAIFAGGQGRILSSPEGYDTLPSVVHVGTDQQLTVGHRAREKMVLEPTRTIYGSKRFLGRPFASREVHSLGHFFNYRLVAGAHGGTAALVDDVPIPLERISGAILQAARQMASQALGHDISRAIVTVPAYFGETQRAAVREAGELAGLVVEHIINEPTAAAVAFGYGRGLKRTVLVYDLGGGTFDASLLHIDGNNLEVLATDGDPFLGGSDFDDRLTEYALMGFERAHPDTTIRQDKVALQRLRFAVQNAKHQLSETESAPLDVAYLQLSAAGSIDLHQTLERRVFESLTQDLVDRTLVLVDAVLKRAGVRSQAVDEFLLVGGQSRSPHVRRALSERFGKRPSNAVHPDHAVALGAAIVADIMHRRLPLHLIDVLPGSIRMGLAQNKTATLLPRGLRLPAVQMFEVQPPAGASQFKVVLCRGEAEGLADNTLLGTLQLQLNPKSPPGKTQLQLQVDAQGLLAVSVRDPNSGAMQALEVSLLGA